MEMIPVGIQTKTVNDKMQSVDIDRCVQLEIKNNSISDVTVFTSNGGRFTMAPGTIRTFQAIAGFYIREQLKFQNQTNIELLMLII